MNLGLILITHRQPLALMLPRTWHHLHILRGHRDRRLQGEPGRGRPSIGHTNFPPPRYAIGLDKAGEPVEPPVRKNFRIGDRGRAELMGLMSVSVPVGVRPSQFSHAL
ncbi:hypothetical protein KM043_014162 [Ampulex compressa]|nr:hypothetical protein KM043_014162 [Ampulex compressa]